MRLDVARSVIVCSPQSIRTAANLQFTVLIDARFDLDGRAFKSLSAVARAITGTSYSGPVFFGLKPTSRARKAATA